MAVSAAAPRDARVRCALYAIERPSPVVVGKAMQMHRTAKVVDDTVTLGLPCNGIAVGAHAATAALDVRDDGRESCAEDHGVDDRRIESLQKRTHRDNVLRFSRRETVSHRGSHRGRGVLDDGLGIGDIGCDLRGALGIGGEHHAAASHALLRHHGDGVLCDASLQGHFRREKARRDEESSGDE